MSFIFGDFSLGFGALLLSIFIGWVWGADKAAAELTLGAESFTLTKKAWMIMIKFFIPVIIFVILLNLFGIFG